MDSQWLIQLGAQLKTAETQIQQLTQALQIQAQEHQQTRNLIESLAKAQGLEYSQDVSAWVETTEIEGLRRRVRGTPSKG